MVRVKNISPKKTISLSFNVTLHPGQSRAIAEITPAIDRLREKGLVTVEDAEAIQTAKDIDYVRKSLFHKIKETDYNLGRRIKKRVVQPLSKEVLKMNASKLFDLSSSESGNDFQYTAKLGGPDGNSIRVAFVDPGGASATLGVVVSGSDITVNLGRAASALNSTLDEVRDALNADVDALELGSASLLPGVTGTSVVDTAVGLTNLANGELTSSMSGKYKL